MTCGQSTAPRSSRSDHRFRDQSPCPAMRTCQHHWRMRWHSTAEETSNPGGRSPSGASAAPAELQRWTVLKDNPSLRTGTESEAGLVFSTIPGVEHLLSAALDTTSRRNPRATPIRLQVPSSRHGEWSLPTSRWQTLAGLYPDSLAGSGRICLAFVWLAAQTRLNDSGVDTTHRPGGSRALSSNRATRFPNPTDF